MRYRNSNNVSGAVVLTSFLALSIYLLQLVGWLSLRLSFVALTLLLIAYLWVEVRRIRQVHPCRWFLNPVVICAVAFFFMSYGWTNILFFLPPESIEYFNLVPEITSAMVTHQFLALIGAISLLLGYWSSISVRLTRPSIVAKFQSRFLPETDVLKPFIIPLLLAITTASRLFAINQGVFGYGGDYSLENLDQTAAYSQFLAIADDLGTLSLILAALRFFKPGARNKDVFWFWIALLFEVLFGFMSGFKSQVFYPFILVGICFYLNTGKIPHKWVILSLIGIFVAYAVIEPFRMLAKQSGGSLTSVTSITDTLVRASEELTTPTRQDEESPSLFLTVGIRSNLSYIGSFGIEYADAHAVMPPNSPAFLENIFLAPLHALIPRFIWNNKPLGTIGNWYQRVVLGANNSSSTGFGPFVYLYFAAGAWSYLVIAVAFFLIGILQRLLFFLLTPWNRLAGAVLFIALVFNLTIIDTSVNGIIIKLVREVPLILILIHLLFRRKAARVNASVSLATRQI